MFVDDIKLYHTIHSIEAGLFDFTEWFFILIYIYNYKLHNYFYLATIYLWMTDLLAVTQNWR